MNKEEAINEIRKQAENGVTGFQILSMDAEDVEMYCGDDFQKRYANLVEKAKEKLLSMLMDECYDTLEEGEEFGFRNLLQTTLDYLDREDRIDEMFANATKA